MFAIVATGAYEVPCLFFTTFEKAKDFIEQTLNLKPTLHVPSKRCAEWCLRASGPHTEEITFFPFPENYKEKDKLVDNLFTWYGSGNDGLGALTIKEVKEGTPFVHWDY